MHYLATLSSKLVAAYQNQENVLNPSKRSNDKVDTRILAETMQAVLEQEIESGRLRYDLLHTQRDTAHTSEQSEPFFAELLFHQG
jgi:DNA-binding NtrC family response regulator